MTGRSVVHSKRLHERQAVEIKEGCNFVGDSSGLS